MARTAPHRLDGAALEEAVGPLLSTSRDEALALALADLGTSVRPRA